MMSSILVLGYAMSPAIVNISILPVNLRYWSYNSLKVSALNLG